MTEQRLLGSRPRPANTAHCQKSGTLELKGQKSKVFAALTLPEMWLYKSEQVRDQTRHPTGREGWAGGGWDGSDGGSLASACAKGRAGRGGQAGERGWQSRKLEILHRTALVRPWAWRCSRYQERIPGPNLLAMTNISSSLPGA